MPRVIFWLIKLPYFDSSASNKDCGTAPIEFLLVPFKRVFVRDGRKIVDRLGVLDLALINFLGFRKTSLYVKLDGILPLSTNLLDKVRKSKENATATAHRIMTLRM